MKYIDDYVICEAKQQNKSYDFIYNLSFKNLNCLPEFKNLIPSNQIYIEPYGFVSKHIKDVDLINEDPDLYVETFLKDTQDLTQLVDITSYLYHNGEGCGINDNSFDCLEYHLRKRLKNKGQQYNKIGALPIDKIKKPLTFGMLR